jgi:hypothetical protein
MTWPFRQPDQILGCHGQHEAEVDTRYSAHFDFGAVGDGLGPSERLFESLPFTG